MVSNSPSSAGSLVETIQHMFCNWLDIPSSCCLWMSVGSYMTWKWPADQVCCLWYPIRSHIFNRRGEYVSTISHPISWPLEPFQPLEPILIYLSIYPSIYLSFIYLSIYLPTYLSIYPSIYLSMMYVYYIYIYNRCICVTCTVYFPSLPVTSQIGHHWCR